MKQTFDQFKLMVAATFEDIRKLTDTKGQEYRGQDESNQHANMDRLSTRLGMLPEQVLLVYLTKHMDSIDTWVKGLASDTALPPSEPISGRIDDALLYLLLLKGMYERRANATQTQMKCAGPASYQGSVERINGRDYIYNAVADRWDLSNHAIYATPPPEHDQRHVIRGKEFWYHASTRCWMPIR